MTVLDLVAVVVSLNCLQFPLNTQRGQMREKNIHYCLLKLIKSSTTNNIIMIFEHPLEPVNKKDNRIEITVSVINRHATQLNGRTTNK